MTRTQCKIDMCPRLALNKVSQIRPYFRKEYNEYSDFKKRALYSDFPILIDHEQMYCSKGEFPSMKKWCHAQKYAFLAAGAQLGGTTRICFSLGIIMLESSANMVFGLPIFVVIITSKLVADMFSHPIYHAECLMKGMPLLEKRPPPYCSWILVKEVMNQQVVALTKDTTVGQILKVLKTTKHNGFPIVDQNFISYEDGIRSSGRLLGIILRSTLVTVLRHKLYKLTTLESLKILRNQFSSAIAVDKELKITGLDEGEEVVLDRFMHTSPMFIQMVVGVITRKDMAVHKCDMTCCTVESKVVPFVEHL
uniref:Chloride channel protein n=1 Tax=Rhodnius prolixus TaxID=13249 RepID=T1H7S1_RHOPR